MAAYGKTYWGTQFLNALENIDYSNRLSRGRRYASIGSVRSIVINKNKIHAKVQGSRRTPYDVLITVPEFKDKQKKDLVAAIKANTIILASLLTRRHRENLVEDFQTKAHKKIFILSLKAGGTGLNLTQAQNVIHYDLWWNPAVETQATDRAYRIGQQNKVVVHRLINKGTMEERIDEMVKDKKELADLTVSSGEKWIGELSNKELKDLVKLSKDL